MTRWCSRFDETGRAAVHTLAVALLLAFLPACRVTDLPLWHPLEAPSTTTGEVERIRGIIYTKDEQADPLRHRLDLFLPKGKKDFPVVVLVHGGAWMLGDNRCCGLYSSVGEFLASQGVGVVMPNYRLSPGVKHPKHIQDLARAFAWTVEHIAEHGGSPDQLFLVGHSAGGHLVALLTTDEQYLQAEGLRSDRIQGVIGISGVYRIPEGKTKVVLGGTSPLAFRLDAMMPLRADGPSASRISAVEGLHLCLNFFGPVFGDDPQVRQAASPVNHVRPGLPPFLLLNAEKDLPLLPGMAEEFDAALRKQGGKSRWQRIEQRNHNSIMFQAVERKDPAAAAMLDFVREHVPGKEAKQVR